MFDIKTVTILLYFIIDIFTILRSSIQMYIKYHIFRIYFFAFITLHIYNQLYIIIPNACMPF